MWESVLRRTNKYTFYFVFIGITCATGSWVTVFLGFKKEIVHLNGLDCPNVHSSGVRRCVMAVFCFSPALIYCESHSEGPFQKPRQSFIITHPSDLESNTINLTCGLTDIGSIVANVIMPFCFMSIYRHNFPKYKTAEISTILLLFVAQSLCLFVIPQNLVSALICVGLMTPVLDTQWSVIMPLLWSSSHKFILIHQLHKFSGSTVPS